LIQKVTKKSSQADRFHYTGHNSRPLALIGHRFFFDFALTLKFLVRTEMSDGELRAKADKTWWVVRLRGISSFA
jgi:hypothetical protein